ncbi:hypothetical protein ACTL6U_13020 [Rhodovibrionaceae bacterium A322]
MSRIREIFASTGPHSHFFGYYDKSPLDHPGQRLLALRCDLGKSLPGPEDQVEVGYFDIETKDYLSLGTSRAFNWQQGAMVQWLGPDFARKIIYNDRRGNEVFAVVHDLESGQKQEFPGGVTSVTPCGRKAVALDWHHLAKTRPGYSYAGLDPEKSPEKENALWVLDLETGERQRLIGLPELLAYKRLSSMAGAAHSLEHPMVSPDGKRFCFYHRWILQDGGVFTRLYSLGLDGQDLRLLLDSGKVTHACWRGADRLVLWGAMPSLVTGLRRHKLLIKTLLKPLLPLYRRISRNRPSLQRAAAGLSYLDLKDQEGTAVHRLADGMLTRDGHPSFQPGNTNSMLTDSYPDADGHQQLFLYDDESKSLETLGSFATLPDHQETGWRCDLHPRWDHSGRKICIDSLHSGQRQVHLFELTGA